MKLVRYCNIFALLLSTSCKEVILHELDERSANRVMLALERSGITAEKESEGKLWNISVSNSKVISAIAALEQSRLLKQPFQNSFEKNSSFIQTQEERSRNEERKLSFELEQTLEQLPNVLEARVHLRLPLSQQTVFTGNFEKGTASVVLLLGYGAVVDKSNISQIIAGASGLRVDEVNVVLIETEVGEQNDVIERTATAIISEKPKIEFDINRYLSNAKVFISDIKFEKTHLYCLIAIFATGLCFVALVLIRWALRGRSEFIKKARIKKSISNSDVESTQSLSQENEVKTGFLLSRNIEVGKTYNNGLNDIEELGLVN